MINRHTQVAPANFAGDFQIITDRETAELIVAALEIVNPDDPAEEEWARIAAFNIRSCLDRFPAPQRRVA